MRFQSLFFVAFFMAVPSACLIYGWQHAKREPDKEGWREELATIGLALATLCLALISGFLFQGYHPHGQSYATRASSLWLILNWVSVGTWALACLAVALGKGSLRLSLFIWCLAMPLFAYMAFMTGFTY